MVWNLYFFQTSRGEKVVKEFIKSLSGKTIGKIAQHIDLLKTHGPFLSMPYSKKLTKDISELRIRGKGEIRIFYTFSKNNIYLLHAFKKKTQKTPKKEIGIAEDRKRVLESS
ncbi:MAG: Phage-related protein [Candidatus Woesebacteria bacterium GW2011_GWA1_39_21b]|uniref:Phage-related protein n=1 Tax=Candidatus Woesebacteria bacterium GW2011_GWA1_39_21b TaxID=1618551 RepID=A0A0G0NCD4_9BACT|nr:MAG: Phage-related protein [Microgenomates group bacterium GW2011_GWC1_38_12]KKR13123.1 MAG: Phage-related protein [Candidatus Woesebacteria bacterium GW2011_GWA1_39_21b]